MTLDFPSEADRLKRRLSEFSKWVDEQAEQARRTREQLAHAKAYGDRREPPHQPNNPEAA